MRQSAIAKPRSPAKRVAGTRRGAGGKTLTERAYQKLEERIVTLQLKPGAFISTAALAHDLKDRADADPRSPAAIEPRGPRHHFAPQKAFSFPRLTRVNNFGSGGQARNPRACLVSSLKPRTAPPRRSANSSAPLPQTWIVPPNPTTISCFMRLDREPQSAHYRGRAERLCRACNALVQGHPRRFWYPHYGRSSPICRCALGCTPIKPVRSRLATTRSPPRRPID